jgi:CheY-like chemotaxis protein
LPDVILLDLMMAEMDGFELVAALQAKGRLVRDPDRRRANFSRNPPGAPSSE